MDFSKAKNVERTGNVVFNCNCDACSSKTITQRCMGIECTNHNRRLINDRNQSI